MKKRILISGACMSMLFAGASIFSVNQNNKVEINNAEATGPRTSCWECNPSTPSWECKPMGGSSYIYKTQPVTVPCPTVS
ncbi:MAG: hypothetical protein H6586_06800 [Flavobacteriales bacterium]|nr:hypothetical protein [Flavobacteriales bacterium]